jgi:cysteine-rich repeat protein
MVLALSLVACGNLNERCGDQVVEGREACGDSIIQTEFSEACDDGNNTNNDGLSELVSADTLGAQLTRSA